MWVMICLALPFKVIYEQLDLAVEQQKGSSQYFIVEQRAERAL